MKIQVTFLGTASGIPTARRNHTAILLQYKDENILVDCGEGTQRQFRKAKLSPCIITRVLITHWDGDHTFGLPGLLQTLAMSNYSRTLHIYIPKGTSNFINLIFKLFVFQGKIKYEIHEIDEGIFFENRDFLLEASKMQHTTPCLAYSFVEKAKLRIIKTKLEKYKVNGRIISELAKGKDITWQGKKIRAKELTYLQKARKITFILDTKLNENMLKIAKNSDLLVCESSYTEQESGLAKEYKHLTAKQAAQTAKASKAKKLILTHLSQRYDNKERQVLLEAKKIFKNVQIAEDLDKIEV